MASLQDLVSVAAGVSARTDSLVSLIDIIEDPMVEASSLVPIVENDPGLTAGLLKLCNSSMYNFQRTIGSPREALVLVGNLAFARLCFALSIEPVLRRDLPGYGLDSDRLWQHSLLTAYGAASLVQAMGQRELRDRAFTAGLLHDIGKIVLDPELVRIGVGEEHRQVAARVTTSTRAATAIAAPPLDAGGAVAVAEPTVDDGVTPDMERILAGHDHAEAGAALLTAWRLPIQIVTAVRWHHEPHRAGAQRVMASALHVAELVTDFAVEYGGDLQAVELWVADRFGTEEVPLEAVRKLANRVSAKRENIISLAAGPII
ncbi:MAG: HDOD domain-containing protein [bacterium]|nr:HDOD domain-containing protein [bacterium]